MDGWLRKAENKAKAQRSWGLGLAELGKRAGGTKETSFIVFYNTSLLKCNCERQTPNLKASKMPTNKKPKIRMLLVRRFSLQFDSPVQKLCNLGGGRGDKPKVDVR